MASDVWLPYGGKGKRCTRCRFDRTDGWMVLTLEGNLFVCRLCSPRPRQVRQAADPSDIAPVKGGHQWSELCSELGNCCLMCGAVGRLTRDHVLPKARGGKTARHNLQPLCVSCNSAKNALHIDCRSRPAIWFDEGRLVVWTEEHTRLLRAGASGQKLRNVRQERN